MTLKTALALLAIHVAVLVSCSKDKSFETDQNAPTPGLENPTAKYGWAYTGNSNSFKGCIDTAYKVSNQAATVLSIEGTDANNNAFLIAIGSPTGDVTTGTYSEITGAGMVLTDKDGNTFTSKSFYAKITNINNNEVTLEFNGAFTDDPTVNNTVYTISSGTLKAVIGGDSPCE